MHAELARRRAYLHLCRWTSLGLSLIEAMAMGMPVVALATTEAVAAVPPGGRGARPPGSTRCVDAAQWLVDDPAAARRLGAAARAAALARYGLDRFLARLGPAAGGGSYAHRDDLRARQPARRRSAARTPAGRTRTSPSCPPRWPRPGHDVRVYTRRDAADLPPVVAMPGRGRRWCTCRPGRPSRCPRTTCCRTWASSAAGWPRSGARRLGAGRGARALLDERAGRGSPPAGRPACRWCRPTTRSARSSAATRAPPDTSPAAPHRVRAGAGPGGRPGRRAVPGRGARAGPDGRARGPDDGRPVRGERRSVRARTGRPRPRPPDGPGS